ncbi:oligosaccharide flippase family protein [Thalassobaculum sp.]|uniref:lipopolysaccharide biosynthesis protein n=1 Tax=Thalassobaculum sp. TaxID=2022740 RepID=UPI0032EE7E8E
MLNDMVVVTGMKVAGTLLWLIYTVLLARLLPPDDYGLVMYAITVLSIAGPLTCFGLNSAMLRHGSVYWHQDRPHALKALLAEARRVIVMAALIGVLVVVVVFQVALGIGDGIGWPTVAIVAIGMPLYGAMDLHRETLRALDRVIAGFLGFNILRSLIPGAVAAALAVVGWLSVDTALAGFVGGLVVIATLDARRIASIMDARRSASAVDRSDRSDWYRIARPMVLAEALVYWTARGDILIVGAMIDLKAAAIYLTAQRLAVLVTFVVDAVRLTLEPMIARRFADRDQAGMQDLLARGSLASLVSGLPIGFAIIAGGWLLLGLYGPEFQQGWAVLAILTAGQMSTVLAGPVSAVLRMTGLERPLTAILIAGAVGQSVAVPVGILAGGLEGAAAAAALVTVASNFAYLAIVRRRLGLRSGPGSGMFEPALIRSTLDAVTERARTLLAGTGR